MTNEFAMLLIMNMMATATLALNVGLTRPSAELWTRTKCGGPSGTADIPSRWASQVNASVPPLHQYPRPNLVRGASDIFDRDRGDPTTWLTLNGLWEWEPAASAADPPPFGKTLASSILVPFPIESCLSGVAPDSSSSFVERSYYRLAASLPSPTKAGNRFLLHFGAINWQAAIYLNGELAANHTGGYEGVDVELPSAPANAVDVADRTVEIIVGVYNPVERGAQPNGKARISAISNPGGDTYTPASGIWQSVWLEEVPAAYISRVQLDANESALIATAFVETPGRPSSLEPSIAFEVLDPQTAKVLASGSARAGAALALAVPAPRLWSSTTPYLYDLRVSCAKCGDAVLAYFGMRTFKVGITPRAASLRGERENPVDDGRRKSGRYRHLTALLVGPNIETANVTIDEAEAKCDADPSCVGFTYPSSKTHRPTGVVPCSLKRDAKLYFTSQQWQAYVKNPASLARPLLNGQPVFLVGWLDQSYWPDGIYTAPTDEALAFDLQSVSVLGMNTVRLHQKVGQQPNADKRGCHSLFARPAPRTLTHMRTSLACQVNPERWYYAADRYGVLVMQDAVQVCCQDDPLFPLALFPRNPLFHFAPDRSQKYGGASNATIPLFESDLTAMIRARGNHPSIVQWEAFNEQDCYEVFKTPPHAVADVVALARRTDWQGRPVDTDSGGGANYDEAGDVNDVHSYPYPGNPLASGTKYAMIGEFGGIGTFVSGKQWVPEKCTTYLHVNTSQSLSDTYIDMAKNMLAQIPRGLSSSIYTQITDVELECDGFFNYDRSPKLNDAQTRAIAAANRELIQAAAQ